MTEPADSIDGIPLHSLKRYLVATGWRRRDLSSGNVLFSTEPEGEEVEILLPETSHVRDLRVMLEGAVLTLSALERRNVVDVIAAVRAISFDLVRSRLPDTAIRHDTIRLGAAEEFIRRMTKILAAAAHGELHVGPYAQRLSSTATTYAVKQRELVTPLTASTSWRNNDLQRDPGADRRPDPMPKHNRLPPVAAGRGDLRQMGLGHGTALMAGTRGAPPRLDRATSPALKNSDGVGSLRRRVSLRFERRRGRVSSPP